MAPILGCQLALAKASSDGCPRGRHGRYLRALRRTDAAQAGIGCRGRLLGLVDGPWLGVYEEPERVAVRTLKLLRGVAPPAPGSYTQAVAQTTEGANGAHIRPSPAARQCVRRRGLGSVIACSGARPPEATIQRCSESGQFSTVPSRAPSSSWCLGFPMSVMVVRMRRVLRPLRLHGAFFGV